MKVCLRLRHLIRECVPCELEESAITRSHSTVITSKVVQAAKEAGGQKYRSCVVREALILGARCVRYADVAFRRCMPCLLICDGLNAKPFSSCGMLISTTCELLPALSSLSRCEFKLMSRSPIAVDLLEPVSKERRISITSCTTSFFVGTLFSLIRFLQLQPMSLRRLSTCTQFGSLAPLVIRNALPISGVAG